MEDKADESAETQASKDKDIKEESVDDDLVGI